MISQLDLQKIKNIPILPLVSNFLNLKKSSNTLYKSLCPFHSNDTDPSLIINIEKNNWKCYGCGESGDVIDFYSKIKNIDFRNSVKDLSNNYSIKINMEEKTDQNDEYYKILEESKAFYNSMLYESCGVYALRFLFKERRISEEATKSFFLGYSPHETQKENADWKALTRHLYNKKLNLDKAFELGLLAKTQNTGKYYDFFRGRIIFPVIRRNKTIGFSARKISKKDTDSPKYINSKESLIYKKHNSLYKHPNISRIDYLVEGNIDVINMWQNGFENVAGTLGGCLTDNQAKIISKKSNRCLVIGDNDTPGIKFSFDSIQRLINNDIEPLVTFLKCEDPGIALKEELEIGVKNKIHGLYWFIEHIKKYEELTPETKINIAKKLKPLLENIKDPVLFLEYLKQISLGLKIPIDYILNIFGKNDSKSCCKNKRG